jgi:hypothetical protein
MNIDDAPRLRKLCEKASQEYDQDKLLDLVRQINELLEKNRGVPGMDDLGKKALAIAVALASRELRSCLPPAWVLGATALPDSI